MITNSKIIIVAVAALVLGAGVGALVMHRSSQPETLTAGSTATASPTESLAQPSPAISPNNDQATANASTDQQASGQMASSEQGRVYERTGTRYVRGGSYSRSRRVYYNYEQPHRSFWSKHRDKLTVAMGTGGGALIGAIAGGGKGAAIGSLAGAGGSALYTYKIRKRHRSY
jgi:hypothetical protein